MAPSEFLGDAPWGSSSLPLLSNPIDCTSYDKTVAPFTSQLNHLPYRVLDALVSLDTHGLLETYKTTNPLISAFALSLALAPVFFVVSEANKNYSQVDRVWSILPTLYNAHFWLWAAANGIRSTRLDAVLLLSAVWSARLTYNYWRKGGYNIGSEDYRWMIVKKQVNNAPIWIVFNAVFISLIQSVLLFSITMPTYVLLLASQFYGPSLTHGDRFFIGLLLVLIATEFTADEQQWRYQSAKQTYRETARVPKGYRQDDLDRGFNTTGLWRYSRHPNFAAEQAVWCALYLWSCVETLNYSNWTCVGALSYLALFQGSTWLTEKISAGKYTEYEAYQDRVGKFLPALVGQSWSDYVEPNSEDESGDEGHVAAGASSKRASGAAAAKKNT